MIKLLSLFLVMNMTSAFSQVDEDRGDRSVKQNLCDLEALKSYNPIRGTVPLTFGHLPSTDLLCDSDECGGGFIEGDVLSPKQAFKYYQKRFQETRCQWTLSDLDPKDEPNIWSNTLSAPINTELDDLDLNDLDKVQFVSKGWARLGSYRVTVNKNNSYGTPLQYTLILSKNVHNYLLRKTLLRKLGYIIPPIKHVKRLKVSFDSKKQKDEFIKNVSVNNAGSFDRWILSEKRKEVVLQDIVVMEDQEFNLNLAKGYVSADIFQGKRVYDSLIVPYALTHVLESINLTDWTVGSVYSENVAFKYDGSKDFSTSKDDATWMVRRIMKLTERDWQEIVDSTALPPSVKVLLLEKLKSRRNHLGTLFNVQNTNLPVDHLISNHTDLEDGKLTKEFYDGYARRFKIPDPESPLAYSDMKAFFKSKAITVGLELLVNAVNSVKYLGTDLAGNIENFYEDLSENLAETISTGGDTNKLPVKAYAFPTIRGNLILNRDIVTGSYLGTDNLIQLVDTVGASVSGGVFGGITGIYSKTGKLVPVSASETIRKFLPVDVNGNASVFVNRTYSHVKPITSVQKALKYPFKNMMVPLLKKNYGHYFDAVMTSDYDQYTQEEKLAKNRSSYQKLVSLLSSIEIGLKNILAKAQREDVMSAVAKTQIDLQNIKESYESTTDKSSTLAPILNSIKTLNVSFQSAYLTYPDCRDEAVESLDKYFSIVEREVKSEDADGIERVSGTEKVICTVNKRGKIAKGIRALIENIDTMTTEVSYHSYRLAKKQRDFEMNEITKLLDENLEVGESLIVQDSVGGALSVGLGVDLYNVVKVRASVKPNKLVISRLHILRKSQTEIHIYKDLGNVNSVELAMSLEKFVPIMKITVKGTKGKGRTKFYNVDIGKYSKIVKDSNGKIDEERSILKPNRLEKMQGLRRAFLTGSVSDIDTVQKPYTIMHKFNENNNKLGLLVYRWNWLKQEDKMTISTPEGHERKVYRQVKGYTKGRDFESYTRDLVDLLFAKLSDASANISSFNEGNPGYTFMGRAKNRITSYEGIVNDEGVVEEPYTKVTRIWNGWKMKKDKALETLREIKKKYGFKFFEESVLAQTKEIFLYNINVNFFVYNTGLAKMLDIKKDKLKEIWKKNQSRDMTNFTGTDTLVRSGYHRFLKYRRKYSKYLLKNDQKKSVRMIIKMVEMMESKLKLEGMSQILGGKHNFFAIARIDGFRVGDENGDKKILSNSFGRLGTEDVEGPLNRLRKFIGITNGEFFMSWLLGRVL
jgi:hypothetical protein